MLRLGSRRTLGVVLRRKTHIVRCSSTSASSSHHPNAPLELDPAFQALLRDIEMSLRNKDTSSSRGPRELEVFPHDPETELDYLTSAELDARDDDMSYEREGRKSPAAAFGSQRIGAVVLPFELQSSIGRMVGGEHGVLFIACRCSLPISDSDKHELHRDAKRLFMDESTSKMEWNSSYDAQYKSGKEAGRHALKDATAFATVALPAHYSAIYSVLDHVKQRLGPEWEVERVIDWGAATGSGLWFVQGSCLNPCVLLTSACLGRLDMRFTSLSTGLRQTWRICKYLVLALVATSVLTNGKALCGSGSV